MILHPDLIRGIPTPWKYSAPWPGTVCWSGPSGNRTRNTALLLSPAPTKAKQADRFIHKLADQLFPGCATLPQIRSFRRRNDFFMVAGAVAGYGTLALVRVAWVSPLWRWHLWSYPEQPRAWAVEVRWVGPPERSREWERTDELTRLPEVAHLAAESGALDDLDEARRLVFAAGMVGKGAAAPGLMADAAAVCRQAGREPVADWLDVASEGLATICDRRADRA